MRTNGTTNGMKATMSGKLSEIYASQLNFQKKIEGVDSPIDDCKKFQYHMTALQEELGELLKVDKRWKSHRNTFYDRDEKLSEFADVFITVLNIAIFSGFSIDEVTEATLNKIAINNERVDSELRGKNLGG